MSKRRTAFTVADLARGIGSGHSTAANLINVLRGDGRVRLVGRKGHSNTYVSTIGGG